MRHALPGLTILPLLASTWARAGVYIQPRPAMAQQEVSLVTCSQGCHVHPQSVPVLTSPK